MNDLTRDVLNWLDDLSRRASLRLDKEEKKLADEALRLISRVTLEPVEAQEKFGIPEELKNAPGYIPSVPTEGKKVKP
ncbi:MAG: hypothetical protein PHE17_17995 [Thiothrix sp.]|uniref:hypothetical protein n=1 Tax=Thiothrix sp. TaxID=1032 RepID=UPI00262947A2|nr:hypothetical protein [Thiothrix sp.]MDD5394913.1 hypothetical protein [Thiothrix sp.]